jgi:hypothetical protein
VVWQLNPTELALAFLLMLISCLALAWAWREFPLGWRMGVSLPGAIRAWVMSNVHRLSLFHRAAMGRLFAEAERAGVPETSAPGAAVLPHLLTIATGTVVAVALTALSRFNKLGPISLAGFVIAIVVLVAAVSLTSPAVAWRIGWEIERPDGVRPAEPEALGAAMFANLIAWAGFGMAVRLLGLGVLNGVELPWALATGAYAAGWVSGAVFRFLPGGLGVREGVFFILVKGSIGPGPALALAVVTRVALVVTEMILATPSLVQRSPERATA